MSATTVQAGALDSRPTATSLPRPAAAGVKTQPTAPASDLGRPAFASVEIHGGFAPVLPDWTQLLRDAPASPYQNPDFLAAWARHAGRAEGAETLIALARDEEGGAVALAPLCVARRFGVATARFLGGGHVNYNMAVVRRDRLDAFADGEAARLLGLVAAMAGVDLYVLVNQPQSWMGTANPLASLPRQPSADAAYCGPLAPSVDDHLKLHVSAKQRSNQRRKTRRFEERGTPRLYRAETGEERARLLEAFLEQKAAQLAARGLGDAFRRPGVRAFLADACGLSEAPPTIELYGFELDGEIVAVTGAIASAERHSGMFNSITSGDHAKYSPGEILMTFVVEEAIRRGRSGFDLGIGAAAYKRLYCPTLEPLFDSIFGVTARGRAVAGALSAMAAAKATIKANPRAYGLIQRIRKARAARGAAAHAADAES